MADYRISKLNGVMIGDNRVPDMQRDIEELKQGGTCPPEVENSVETNGLGWTEDGGFITWDGDTTGLEPDAGLGYAISFPAEIGGVYKISDMILSEDNLFGNTCVIHDDAVGDIDETIEASQTGHDDKNAIEDYNGSIFICVTEETEVIDDSGDEPITYTVEPGVYFVKVLEGEHAGYTKSVEYTGTVHTIDKKYLKTKPEIYRFIVNLITEGSYGLSVTRTVMEQYQPEEVSEGIEFIIPDDGTLLSEEKPFPVALYEDGYYVDVPWNEEESPYSYRINNNTLTLTLGRLTAGTTTIDVYHNATE